MRVANIDRVTNETKIRLSLGLDGEFGGEENSDLQDSVIDTGVGFLDHMLTLFSRHGNFALSVICEGDTYVDDHHTVEDIGICLGQAFSNALGDKAGISRYGNMILPMDEALILCAVDISGRDYLGYDINIPTEKVGDFDTELVQEFFLGFTRNASATLHFKQLAGTNSHHLIEGMFKAFGRTMKEAVSIDPSLKGAVPSTKGVL